MINIFISSPTSRPQPPSPFSRLYLHTCCFLFLSFFFLQFIHFNFFFILKIIRLWDFILRNNKICLSIILCMRYNSILIQSIHTRFACVLIFNMLVWLVSPHRLNTPCNSSNWSERLWALGLGLQHTYVDR